MATIKGTAILMMSLMTLTLAMPDKEGTIDIEPALSEIREDDEVKIKCTFDVRNPSEKVIWRHSNRIVSPYESELSDDKRSIESVFKISSMEDGDQGEYICSYGQLMKSIFIDLQLPPEIEVISGTLNPGVGDEIKIECTIDGIKNQKIRWGFVQVNGTKRSPAEYKQLTNVQEMELTTDRGSALYITVPRALIELSGTYVCISPHNKSNDVTIHVSGVSADCGGETMMTATMGTTLTIKCVVKRYPICRENELRWRYPKVSDNSLNRYKYAYKVEPDEITVAYSLTITNITMDDNDANFSVIFIAKDGREITLTYVRVRIDPAISCKYDSDCGEGMICRFSCQCKVGYMPDPNTYGKTCIERRPGGNPSDPEGSKGGKPNVVDNHTSTALIIGSSLGVLAVLLLVILIIMCYWRKRKTSNSQEPGYRDPSYLYQYEYHSEAHMPHYNPTFNNPGYQVPPPKRTVRKENTYVTPEKERLEFPRERLQLGVDLGQGRFGKVIQARANNITGSGNWEKVAVKTCRATATDSEKQDLYQELEIMRKIPSHPNVVTLLGCCSKTDPLYIIIEYVQRGSLLDYLRKCRPSSIMSRGSRDSMLSRASTPSSFMQPRAKDLTIFALQVARGMAHVASCGIIHRDLAARNVLLATDFTCKICDFGLARDVEGVDVYERTSKGPLPIRWMAPEALADNLYTRKSDVWSYGILLWEIVTLGATPYQGMSAMEVMRLVMQGQCLQRPLHCREEMYQLMELCWAKPDNRPSFADIVTHHEALMDDDYIVLSDYEEGEYGWLDSYATDERV